jgi:hypothetical protein
MNEENKIKNSLINLYIKIKENISNKVKKIFLIILTNNINIEIRYKRKN